MHPRIFLEHKLRASHSVLSLWRETKTKAHKEGKDPVVILSEKGKPGQWLLVHTTDLAAIVANWLAAQDDDMVADVLYKSNQYRLQDQE